MHINMKYYIVTISAIFIALGIGILVGFNLNYDQELSQQQAEVINDLDEKFEALKETNDNLEGQLGKLETNYDKTIEFINQNIDKLVADELSEKNIGIISTNENDDYTKDLEETINKSGGNIAFNIVLKNNITEKSKLEEISTKLGTEIKSTSDAMDYIVEALKGKDAKDKLVYLQELGVIKLNNLGENYSEYTSVIIAGGNSNKDGEKQFEKIDKILIPKLKEENKYVIGVQKTDTEFSYTDLYSKSKIATIDNVDEEIGKLSLVLILKEGNIVGNFGRSDSANSLVPYKK